MLISSLCSDMHNVYALGSLFVNVRGGPPCGNRDRFTVMDGSVEYTRQLVIQSQNRSWILSHPTAFFRQLVHPLEFNRQ